ncbi:hypothetical protein TTHERM_001639969 (macronuclear) [Tetrahymena thermophila SB210]|uniref:Uncharacterized protein n=1 Tax=Tetrahymena thermophila (strain SB210) TaxID=312017 RepID=W7XB92_TETTS|nr:hypothetical protein TTHERM_001639969 [Tetrahymena thermophila SB210]EWS73688.1 hypothetical protein TTHERM_001639969 [Tetrahymena thermophila SB210]|eukprot:XP_012653818.1 hypothetical protein TTHERM_001639969 [Tetrahymena thermophila SB210]
MKKLAQGFISVMQSFYNTIFQFSASTKFQFSTKIRHRKFRKISRGIFGLRQQFW